MDDWNDVVAMCGHVGYQAGTHSVQRACVVHALAANRKSLERCDLM